MTVSQIMRIFRLYNTHRKDYLFLPSFLQSTMSFRNLSIKNKLIGGFALLTLMFVINAAISLYNLNKSASIIQQNIEVGDPSTLALRDLRNIITSSKGYITNWIYQQSNQEDKDALKALQTSMYPEVKQKIVLLRKSWQPKQQKIIESVLARYDSIEVKEKQIMTELSSFEDYEKDGGLVKFNANVILETEILPMTQKSLEQIEQVIREKGTEAAKNDELLLANFDSVRRIVFISAIIVILFAILATVLLSRDIVQPISYVRSIIQKLSLGELPEKQNRRFNRDEVGEMAVAVEKLANGLRDTSLFAEKIGKGNYEVEHAPLSERDVLGNALIEMRNNLKRVAEEDKRRNWATEGLATFGELLRKNTSSIEDLCDEIMSGLVKYTHSNQGGLFIVNDEEQGQEPFLELKACYAWDKKKYIEQKIYEGEGLTGQVWQEGVYVYMTEVPSNYITITSGLGEANPRSILIMPLKVNDQIFGVIELASFNELAGYEIEFVEKIAESIASTLSSVKVNVRTQRLYEESTLLTEQLKGQEEEMRQNMEELIATQEEMERKQAEREAITEELQKREEVMRKSLEKAEKREKEAMHSKLILQKIIDLLPRAVFWKDLDLRYLGCNQLFAKSSGKDAIEEMIGKNDYDMHWTKEESDSYRSDDREVLRTQKPKIDIEEHQTNLVGEVLWIRTTKVPLVDEENNPIGVLGMFEDITESKKQAELMHQQQEVLQSQEEELRQNVEELLSIQEELQRKQQEAEKREKDLLTEVASLRLELEKK